MTIIYVKNLPNEENIVSIETQIEACKKALNGKPYEVFCDSDDISCPEFARMMNEVERGNVTKIIVYKLNLLSRSISDFIKIQNTLERHNVSFESVQDRYNSDTPSWCDLINTLKVFAELSCSQ